MNLELVDKATSANCIQSAVLTDIQGDVRHAAGFKDESVRFVSLVIALTQSLSHVAELGCVKQVIFSGDQDSLMMALEQDHILAVQSEDHVCARQVSETLTRLVMEA